MGYHKQLWIDATPADLRDRAAAERYRASEAPVLDWHLGLEDGRWVAERHQYAHLPVTWWSGNAAELAVAVMYVHQPGDVEECPLCQPNVRSGVE